MKITLQVPDILLAEIIFKNRIWAAYNANIEQQDGRKNTVFEGENKIESFEEDAWYKLVDGEFKEA